MLLREVLRALTTSLHDACLNTVMTACRVPASLAKKLQSIERSFTFYMLQPTVCTAFSLLEFSCCFDLRIRFHISKFADPFRTMKATYLRMLLVELVVVWKDRLRALMNLANANLNLCGVSCMEKQRQT